MILDLYAIASCARDTYPICPRVLAVLNRKLSASHSVEKIPFCMYPFVCAQSRQIAIVGPTHKHNLSPYDLMSGNICQTVEPMQERKRNIKKRQLPAPIVVLTRVFLRCQSPPSFSPSSKFLHAILRPLNHRSTFFPSYFLIMILHSRFPLTPGR